MIDPVIGCDYDKQYRFNHDCRTHRKRLGRYLPYFKIIYGKHSRCLFLRGTGVDSIWRSITDGGWHCANICGVDCPLQLVLYCTGNRIGDFLTDPVLAAGWTEDV